jgi:peptidoglycan-associated lipoprotein
MTHLRRFVSLVVLTTAICVAAAACRKQVPPQTPTPPAPAPPVAAAPAPPPPPPPPPPAPPRPVPAPAALSEEEIFSRKSLEQVNAEKPLGDVFFDLDQATIRDEARTPLQRNADWMKKWGSTQVIVEGHCDSRGSAEYNLALGSRRATAVKDYLVNLGVPANRVTIVSKGKEQPFCSEESESCWQQNRRGHFIVSAK